MTKKRENLERNWIKSRKQKMGPYVKIFLNGAKKKKKKKRSPGGRGKRGEINEESVLFFKEWASEQPTIR